MITADTDATPTVSGHDADAGSQGGAAIGEWPYMNHSDTYQAALAYQARGWSLVTLHWITAAGQCSCGRPGCKSAGKHPHHTGWQMRDESPQRWADRGATYNIGIRTGTPSGFWVLDYDPSDADDAGLYLAVRLQDEGYAPHVRTGGGGDHYRFRLPDFVVRNRQSAGGGAGRTHGLPRGWDVRGEGGQVVAPPSVSAKGAYVELLNGGAHDAPGWLLDMIRPPARDDPPNHTVSTLSELPGGPYGGPVAGTGVEGSSHSADRVQAYCTAVLRAECSEYAALDDGRRSERMFDFACTLVRIANTARWSTEVGGTVYEWFENATLTATANRPDGGYAPHEVPGQWERGRAEVGDGIREIPTPDILAAFTPDFPSAVAALPDGLRIVEPGDAPPLAAGDTAPGGTERVTTPAPEPPAAPPTGMSPSVWSKVQALDDLDAAKRFRADRDVASRPPLESELLTGDALGAVVEPVPVVDGWLFADSLARLNGRPGQGKSFVAIDLACAVATGTAWHGQAVRQSPVLLIVAEGVSGVRKRVRAWEAVHGVKVGDALIVLPRAVQVTSPEWTRLVRVAAARGAGLVVVDTQARVTAGLNENLSADMGLLVQALEDLRAATGACVLTVHHKGKGDGEGGRGSNAVEGAMVSEFDVWKRGHLVTVKNTKQKDIEGGYQVEFSLTAEGDSAVLVRKLEIVEPVGGESWKAQARALYEVLRAHSGAAGISKADAKAAAIGLDVFSEGRSPRSVGVVFGYAWNNLIMRGLLIRHLESKHFGVHVMGDVGPDGVLTPNVGEWAVADPTGWQTFAPDAVDPKADWSVNLGKTGGTRISAAVRKMSGKP